MGYGDLEVSIREELPMTASMVVYYVEQIMKEEGKNEENIHK